MTADEEVEQVDLLAALQRSINRHKARRGQAQAAQEPRSAPPEGEGTRETAQSNSAPYGWVLVDNFTRRVLSPAPTREDALQAARRWDEAYPGSAGRYSVARLVPDGPQ